MWVSSAATSAPRRCRWRPYRHDRRVLVTPRGHALAATGVIAFTDTLAFDQIGFCDSLGIERDEAGGE